MIKIWKHYFGHLRNGEHFQVHSDIIDLLRTKVATNLIVLAVLLDEYVKSFNTEDGIFKAHLKADETAQLQKLDDWRDAIVKKATAGVDSAVFSTDPMMRESAEVGKTLFQNYKQVYSQPYQENTALITSIVEDCRKPKYAPHIARLGLTETIDELSDVNKEFDELYVQRTLAQYDKQALGSMLTIRPVVDSKFNLFADGVNIAYVTNELGEKNPATRALLTEIIDGVNAIVHQMDVVYHRRAGIKTSGKKKPEIPDVPETPETPDAPETPDVPETPETPDGPSHFAMVNQKFYGNHSGFSGYSTHMSAEAVDPAAFAAALIPAAEGATLRMYTGYEDYFTDFPIESLMVTVDGGSPVPGLVITPQSSNFAFGSTIPDRPELGVEVIKDGEILATIGGVIRPIYVGEG
jgi:hypothetical protein